jgi:Tol biopolymer transport system component/DNA-binding winged helix-turn-helix (wHTH) protein
MRVEFGEFTLDRGARQLLRRGKPLHLEPKAFDLLGLLLERRPEAVAKPEIRDRLWPDTFVSESNLTGLVAQVREALGDDPRTPRYIRTVHGFGYAFAREADEPPSEAQNDSDQRFPSAARRSSRPRRLVVAALSFAMALATAYFLRPSTRKPTARSMTVVPFTSYIGGEFSPTFSPDGSQIAFSWTGRDSEVTGVDLYTKVLGSEKALRLTTSQSDAFTPAWSPDGRTIAYARMARHESGIYLIAALGGPERRLAEVPFTYTLEMHLSWSPDAKLLAFTEGPPEFPWGISILDVATLQKRRLPSPAPTCQWSWMPAFSPDGRSLAQVCAVSIDVNDVYVAPVQGGAIRRVAHVNGGLSGLAWAGDGASLVIAADGNLTRFPVAGGDPEKLFFGRDAATPAVSRDGRRLAYVQNVFTSNLWRVPLGSPAAGGAPVPLVPSSRYDTCPALSADGRRLAFMSNRSGSTEIWISDADGSGLHVVTSFGGPLTGSPRWSPDGRWIAFDSKASGQSDLYVVGSEGGAPERLETGVVDGETPFWSVDGAWLYFSAPVEGRRQVFKVPRAGGRATQLTSGGGEIPQAAPDGQRVYYWKERTEPALWSVSSAGGDERPVMGIGLLRPESFASWEVGSRGIHYVDGAKRRVLRFVDFATGRSRRVVDLPTSLADAWCSIAYAPDGKSLILPMYGRSSSDIMLVNDFE